MGLREWAVKPGELKPLSRGGLLLFSARCAMRVEPWVPAGAAELWADNLAFVVSAAFADRVEASNGLSRQRAISSCGAMACNRLRATDEPLGRCMSYATSTLATAIEAAGAGDRPTVLKRTIEVAKQSASIAAVWAHAGRVHVGEGADAVEVACTATWAAIRSDIAALARLAALETPQDPVRALREVAPLWGSGAPPWSTPPGK